MCCFSGRVEKVDATRIFARMSSPARQRLAYQMKVKADAAVAMILPLPVPAGTGEAAVRFISLEDYPTFFNDVERVFPVPGFVRGGPQPASGGVPKPLEVVKVGNFVASFVPSLADFDRLDPQFRVPPGTLDKIREYQTYGFAVFQLDLERAALTELHPMAFEFPTREATRLFFPTVHVHDGKLPKQAAFAHTLYAQGIADKRWATAGPKVLGIVDGFRARGLIDPQDTVHKLWLYGELPNVDQWAAIG
jgi:hypothetical protein